MDLVESHVHIWTVRDPRYARHPDSDTQPDIEAAPDELFRAQDEIGGVRWTVLIQPRYYLWDNTYLAQAAVDYPDRFVVAGRVDPRVPGAAARLRELMQCGLGIEVSGLRQILTLRCGGWTTGIRMHSGLKLPRLKRLSAS